MALRPRPVGVVWPARIKPTQIQSALSLTCSFGLYHFRFLAMEVGGAVEDEVGVAEEDESEDEVVKELSEGS